MNYVTQTPLERAGFLGPLSLFPRRTILQNGTPRRDDIRNVAIIAHVDHGKTTLIDALLRQSGIFRANEQLVDRVMDSFALERERGITILAKNAAVTYRGVKINFVDTPGHADFGGEVKRELADESEDLQPLLDLIVSALPGPLCDLTATVQFQANNLDYNDYVGRLAIGRIVSGELRTAGLYTLCRLDGSQVPCKVTQLYSWQGLKRIEVETAQAGDVVAVAGIEEIQIGETISDREMPKPLPAIRVDEPTIAMIFGVNTAPWSGREGQFVTSRKLRDRLWAELRKNVSLRVEETDSPDSFRVMGRGELQLAILIETMRREGYELQASKPTVISKEIDGKLQEPMELLLVDVPEDYIGVVSQLLAVRRGVMTKMDHPGSGRVRLEFSIPSRGLIGFRSHFLTDTRGTGIINALFNGYAPWQGPIQSRTNGALVSDREGTAVPYALFHLQERGILFIPAGTPVYEGMVIGEYSRDRDLDVNACREKKLTNMRASGHDEAVRLTPPHEMGLEDALEWIADEELVEVTPRSIRLRKKILPQNLRPKRRDSEH